MHGFWQFLQMNCTTGEIVNEDQICKIFPDVVPSTYKQVYALTQRQSITRQTLAYEACPCGSGKKFKFCCHQSQQETVNVSQAQRAADLLGVR